MITHKVAFAPCQVHMQQHAEKTMKQKDINKQQNKSILDIIIPGLNQKILHCLEGLLQINTQEA